MSSLIEMMPAWLSHGETETSVKAVELLRASWQIFRPQDLNQMEFTFASIEYADFCIARNNVATQPASLRTRRPVLFRTQSRSGKPSSIWKRDHPES